MREGVYMCVCRIPRIWIDCSLRVQVRHEMSNWAQKCETSIAEEKPCSNVLVHTMRDLKT